MPQSGIEMTGNAVQRSRWALSICQRLCTWRLIVNSYWDQVAELAAMWDLTLLIIDWGIRNPSKPTKVMILHLEHFLARFFSLRQLRELSPADSIRHDVQGGLKIHASQTPSTFRPTASAHHSSYIAFENPSPKSLWVRFLPVRA